MATSLLQLLKSQVRRELRQMAKMSGIPNCVPQCDGCVRQYQGQCIAFDEPSAAWTGGRCWGYETDKRKVALALYECVKYSLTKRFDAFVYAEAEKLLNEYLLEYGLSQVEIVRMKDTLIREMQTLAETGHGTDTQTNGTTQ